MKLPRRAAGVAHLVPGDGSPATLVAAGVDAPGMFLLESGERMTSTCLRCPEQPCGKFGEGELPITSLTAHVCPVDAISFDEFGKPLIGTWCVGCGLCVVRCPYGSLFLAGATAEVGVSDLVGFAEVDAETFESFAGALERRVELSPGDVESTVHLLATNAQQLQQDAFYPLVARLLTTAGFPTVVTRQGDTSNRIDAITRLADETIPIEIKSPTESMIVNVKSVQQALENKVIVDARQVGPANPETSSLVVAYEQAPERSDVSELVDDIYQAYGVSVGLLDLRSLYRLAWSAVVDRSPAPPATLSRLRGAL